MREVPEGYRLVYPGQDQDEDAPAEKTYRLVYPGQDDDAAANVENDEPKDADALAAQEAWSLSLTEARKTARKTALIAKLSGGLQEPEKPKDRWKALMAFLMQPGNAEDAVDDDSDDEVNEVEPGILEQENTCSQRVRRFAFSNLFEFVIGAATAVSVFITGIQIECQTLGCDEGYANTIDALMLFFVIFFLIEWFLKLFALGVRAIWQDSLFFLDTFLVWVTGVLGTLILADSNEYAGLRFLKVLRMLRVAKLLKMSPTMRMLVTGILGTLSTLAACMATLWFSNVAFTLVAVEVFSPENQGLADQSTWAGKFQSGFLIAQLTMSRLIFCDDAVTMIEALSIKQPFLSPLVCFGWMALGAYAILNMITAIIVDATDRIAKNNASEKLLAQLVQEKKDLKRLKSLFHDIDMDGNGFVSLQEFEEAFEVPSCKAKLNRAGFTEQQLKKLFRILDGDSEGQLSVKVFVDGIQEVRGDARSKNIFGANQTAERINRSLRKSWGAQEDETTDDQEDAGEDVDETSSRKTISVERLVKRLANRYYATCDRIDSMIAELQAAVAKLDIELQRLKAEKGRHQRCVLIKANRS